MAKTRKTIVMSLRVTGPAGMPARAIRREVLTRINEVGGHFDTCDFDLPDSQSDAHGYLRVRASLAKREV